MVRFDEMLIDCVIYVLRDMAITNFIYYRFVAKKDLELWVRSAVFQLKAKGEI